MPTPPKYAPICKAKQLPRKRRALAAVKLATLAPIHTLQVNGRPGPAATHIIRLAAQSAFAYGRTHTHPLNHVSQNARAHTRICAHTQALTSVHHHHQHALCMQE